MTRDEVIEMFSATRVSISNLERQIENFLMKQEDIRIKDLNLDSLNVMELCIYLEENFGASLTVQEFNKLKNLSDLLKIERA